MNQRVKRKRRERERERGWSYKENMLTHNFLFIHAPRTAGTSTFRALNFIDVTAHFSSQRVRGMIGQEEWDDRFTFGFARNPWDRMVSWFTCHRDTYHNVLYSGYKHFGDWVKDGMPHHWDGPNWKHARQENDPLQIASFLADENGELMVDFVGRFENLHDDLALIFQRIGKRMPELTHVHKTPRKPYREYYDDETRELVTQHCKQDIELFGYEF